MAAGSHHYRNGDIATKDTEHSVSVQGDSERIEHGLITDPVQSHLLRVRDKKYILLDRHVIYPYSGNCHPYFREDFAKILQTEFRRRYRSQSGHKPGLMFRKYGIEDVSRHLERQKGVRIV